MLELPDDSDLPSMYDQAVDQHPLLGGYLSRHYPYWFTVDTPGVAELVASAPAGLQQADIVTPSAHDVALQAMDYYGVRTVIVHPLDGYGHASGLQATLHLIFGDAGQPEDGLTVYTVPHVAQDRAFLFLGDAWYAAEPLAAGGVQRWTDQQATIHVVAPPAGAGAYTLTLQVYAAGGPRTLVAALDDREIAREAVGLPPGVTLHLPLQLAPGEHTLTLASVEPAIQPPHDPRTIGLGYQRITLERAP